MAEVKRLGPAATFSWLRVSVSSGAVSLGKYRERPTIRGPLYLYMTRIGIDNHGATNCLTETVSL